MIKKNVGLFLIGLILPAASLFGTLKIFKTEAYYNPNWGVTAINFGKSSYFTNEPIDISYAILDFRGGMYCNANLEAIIYNQDNKIVQKLSTLDDSISVSETCKTKRFVYTPDFYSQITIDTEGTYTLALKAETEFGIQRDKKEFVVNNNPEFVIERHTNTRIFPKDPYKVLLKVHTYKDFNGDLVEKVPSEFDITSSKLFEQSGDELLWNVHWKKGQTYEFEYEYKAPEVSPDFYTLGKAELREKTILNILLNTHTTLFVEPSSWQIAIDDLVSRYATSCASSGRSPWSNPTNAQSSPNLGSTAAIGSFTTGNSASVVTGANTTALGCTTFDSSSLGGFNSARVWMSLAVAGTAPGGNDNLTVTYDVGATSATLVVFTQNVTEQSNSTNGNYFNYSAPNITSWADIANTTVSFKGNKSGGSDGNSAYVDAVWVEVDYTPRTITQNDFEWFAPEATVTLTNNWPTGSGEDLSENQVLEYLPATNEPLGVGEQIRLQMNFTTTAQLLASEETFALEYVQAEDCTTATGWADVGGTGSGTIWRLYDETTIGPSTTQVNQISTSSATAEGYFSETNPTSSNPNQIEATENSEWDWPIENNGATSNTSYCFRMTFGTGTALNAYNSDSYPQLTTAPNVGSMMKHGKVFHNEAEGGFFWAN